MTRKYNKKRNQDSELMKKLSKKSKLTEKDAKEIAEKIDRAVARKFNLLKENNEEEMDEETKKEIEQARADVKAGNYLTHEYVKKALKIDKQPPIKVASVQNLRKRIEKQSKLSKEATESIKRARKRMKEGKFVTEVKAKKKLGV